MNFIFLIYADGDLPLICSFVGTPLELMQVALGWLAKQWAYNLG